MIGWLAQASAVSEALPGWEQQILGQLGALILALLGLGFLYRWLDRKEQALEKERADRDKERGEIQAKHEAQFLAWQSRWDEREKAWQARWDEREKAQETWLQGLLTEREREAEHGGKS